MHNRNTGGEMYKKGLASTTNIIQVMKLETQTCALKKQGKSIRDIAHILSQKHRAIITASAVFRFLQKDSLKQTAAARPKQMKIVRHIIYDQLMLNRKEGYNESKFL